MSNENKLYQIFGTTLYSLAQNILRSLVQYINMDIFTITILYVTFTIVKNVK